MRQSEEDLILNQTYAVESTVIRGRVFSKRSSFAVQTIVLYYLYIGHVELQSHRL